MMEITEPCSECGELIHDGAAGCTGMKSLDISPMQ